MQPDYVAMMREQSAASGRVTLHAFLVGVISSIINNGDCAEERIGRIRAAIDAMFCSFTDEALPWTTRDK